MRFPGKPQIARHAHRIAARPGGTEIERLAVSIDKAIRPRRCGGGFAPVDRLKHTRLAIMMHQEAAAADAAIMRLYHVEGEHHGDRGVGGAAALTQYLLPRCRRARIGSGHGRTERYRLARRHRSGTGNREGKGGQQASKARRHACTLSSGRVAASPLGSAATISCRCR